MAEAGESGGIVSSILKRKELEAVVQYVSFFLSRQEPQLLE